MATSSREFIAPLKRGEDATRWLLQFEAVAAWQEISEENDRQKNALLAMMGTEAFNMVADAIVPKKPAEVSLKDLKEILLEQFQPKKLPIAARFEFSKLRQGEDDIPTYVRKLRAAADDCEFGQELESRLRDQFVFGIANIDALRKMLTEKLSDLTLKKAIEMATAHEAVKKSQKNWQAEPSVCNVAGQEKRSSGFGKKTASLFKLPYEPKKNTKGRVQPDSENCRCCGKRGHLKQSCRFRNESCRVCNKVGHLEAVCRHRHRQNQVRMVESSTDQTPETGKFIFTTWTQDRDDYMVHLNVNGRKIRMKFDTAADITLLGWRDLNGFAEQAELQPCSTSIKDYNGNLIAIKGRCQVQVDHPNFSGSLVAYVVDCEKQNIMGRDWIRTIFPGIDQQISGVCNLVVNFQAHLTLKEGAKAVFQKPRSIPYGLRENVKLELDRLVNDGILKSVQESEWATPIVPIRKPDGRIRICGDYKATVNPQLMDMVSTTPAMEDILNNLHGARYFTTLDLTNAYHQLPLDEQSAKLTTISTPFGLYEYKSLPFGIKQCPSIFQSYLDKTLFGLSNVQSYQDDVIVHTTTKAEHEEAVRAVKARLEQHGLQLNEAKCVYCQEEVKILGLIVSAKGIRPDPQKVRSIKGFQRPKNASELRSFLGMLEFYGRFMKDLSAIRAPLNQLLKSNAQWHWDESQEHAFQELKNALTQDSVLATFDPLVEVTLTTDASPHGIGAVLEQRGRPVLYVSKSLSKAETNYAQIEREALAVIWAVKRLHKFLYGRKFKLVTDNKPLHYIFHQNKTLSSVTAARLQRWAVTLMAYNYEIVHKATSEIPVPDALSRCASSGSEAGHFEVDAMQDCTSDPPVSKDVIREQSKRDPIMKQLFKQVLHGWKRSTRGPLQQYAKVRNDLVIENGLIFKGNRLVIPPSLRKSVLEELHKGHMGKESMKSFARQSVWWSNIDKDIEHFAKACEQCCKGKDYSRPQWQSWPDEIDRWNRVHIDFAGPLSTGAYALVLVDAYSKWPEVHLMQKTTSEETIRRLRRTFSQEGIPHTLVSDNGPQFTSHEFTEWLNNIGCKHVKTPPYHPKSNGIAERFVRTLKNHLRASASNDLQAEVDRFLLQYRNREHPATGLAPAQVMRGGLLKSPIVNLRRDNVWIRNYSDKEILYEPGDICEWFPNSETTVMVRTEEGKQKLCHKEQLKERLVADDAQEIPASTSELGNPADASTKEPSPRSKEADSTPMNPDIDERPKRERKPPERLNFKRLGIPS